MTANSAPPPQYAASTSSSTSSLNTMETLTSTPNDFFDIVPRPDETSFQVGYLGLQGFPAWVKGDVLIKLDENLRSKARIFRRCIISLRAIENDEEQTIILFSAEKVLWTNQDSADSVQQPRNIPPRSSSNPSATTTTTTTTTDTGLPSTLPFSLSLTSDLPHCIHLPTSSLSYELTSTIESCDPNTFPDVHKTVPVHLTRYSRPGPLDRNESEQPYDWNLYSPTPMKIQINKTLYRRAEPIRVFVRIPPPQDRKLLSLGLRSIEANLIRIITNKSSGAKHELLLAHSGKLCRLHSSKDIVLRLQLRPPFDSSNMPYPHPDYDTARGGPIHGRGGGGGCESISQETLLHDVVFVVGIRICIRGDGGNRRDILLDRQISILPGAAGDEEQDLIRNKEKHSESINYFHAEDSTQAGPSSQSLSVVDDYEEEYDGYEDVGRPLSLEDDDSQSSEAIPIEEGPPPSLLESQNDIQVEVEVDGIGQGVLRSTNAGTEIPQDYVWRTDGVPSSDELPPPPVSPQLVDQANSAFSTQEEAINRSPIVSNQRDRISGVDANDEVSVHFPPPYVATSQQTPRSQARMVTEEVEDDDDETFPPAYPHPSPVHSVSNQFPPSYEA